MAIRQSFLPESIPEALCAVGCDQYREVSILPTQRGSALLVHISDETASVVKIADRSISETEVDIQPPRSIGIINEAEVLQVLPKGVGPVLEGYKDLNTSVVSRVEMLQGISADSIKPCDLDIDFLIGSYMGLKRLHLDGLTHGDVQPANFLSTENGVRLIDFEFAQKIGSVVRNAGQVFFLSPRAAAATLNGETRIASPYEDLFALCAVYLALSNGQRTPFGTRVADTTQREHILEMIADGALRYYSDEKARFHYVTSKIADFLNSQSCATVNEEALDVLLEEIMQATAKQAS